MLHVELISNFDDFKARRGDWNDCLARAAHAPLQMSHDWLSSWYRFLVKDTEFLPLIIYDNKVSVALATVFLRQYRIAGCGFRSLAMSGDVYSNRCAIVMPRFSDEILQAVVNELDALPWTIADIGRVRNDDPITLMLGKQRINAAFTTHCRAGWKCPVVKVDQDWQALLASKSTNFRKSLKRTNRLADGLKTYRVTSKGASLDALLEGVLEISHSSWKQAAGTSLAASPDAWKFYRRVVCDAAENNQLRLNVLYDQNLPIGFIFGVIFKRRLYALKTGYSQHHASSSPGSAIIAHFIRDACEDDAIDCVDLDCLTEHGEYKMRWASEVESYSAWRLFRRNLFGHCMNLGWQLSRTIKKHKPGSQ